MRKVIQTIILIALFSTTIHSVFSQNKSDSRPTITANKQSLTAEQIAQRFLPGVALIICDDGKGNFSQGSGFFIAPGIILTNAHVVKGMIRGVILAGGQQKKNNINSIAYFNSEDTDLALLVSDEAKNSKTPLLPLAKSNALNIGETIYVLSSPKGLAGTISQGIISSGIRQINKKDLLQITAPISNGSSGGAVMNSRGEVVGIATASLQGGQNLNFAVPAARIGQFLDDFLTLPKTSQPIYVRASSISGSWFIPLALFLSQREEDSKEKMPPPDSNNNSQPSFEETTQWLSNKLVGRGFDFGKFLNKPSEIIKTERIIFNGCSMYLEQKKPLDKATVILAYRINIASIKKPFSYPSGNDAVSIELNGEIPVAVKGYLPENYTMNKPDFTDTYNSDLIVLGTDNRESSERVEKAFNFVIKQCKENVKDPF